METILNKESRAAIELMVANGIITKDTAERYFPELKESEDERIRKCVADIIKENTFSNIYGVTKEACLAWLEKQGEHQKFRDSIQVGDKVTRNEDGVLVNLSQLDRVAKKEEPHSNQLTAEMGDILNEYIDMQNNSKDPCIDCDQRAMNCHNFPCDAKKAFDKRKSADKTEPKFNVGDKIQYSKGCGTIMTIEKIENGEYIFGNNMGHATIESGNKWHLVEQKPAWSEEDEEQYKDALDAFEALYNELDPAADWGKLYSWLKSLKNRVQSKQEWSEDDKDFIERLLDVTELWANGKSVRKPYSTALMYQEWLKSLSPQNRWKPTKEQIMALRWVLNHIPYNVHKEELSGLLDKIKDL